MARIRRFIAVSNGMVKIFAVAMMLVMQGGIAHFSAAHSHGSHDHMSPHLHGADNAGHQYVAASHAPDSAVDHKHAGDESGLDVTHLLNCCGWMCTAAICAEEASEPFSIRGGEADDTFVAAGPLDWLPYGPDRPPRSRPQII